LQLICPDDLPYDEILEYELPFLGEFCFKKGEFKLPNNENNFNSIKKETSIWTFDKFLLDKSLLK
jgi:hypothetical protein